MAALAQAATQTPPPARHDAPRDRLGGWSVYFAAKLFLYFRGHIPLDLPLNLLFFLLLLATASPSWPPPARAARRLLAWLAAAALLWHDSWLPSPSFVGGFLTSGALPPLSYIATFLRPLLLSRETLALAAVAAAVGFSRSHIHLTWPIAAAFFFAGVHSSYHPAAAGLDGRLARFYDEQADRRVSFTVRPRAPDLILIHVCSLAQDDLSAAGLADDPFWSGFDVLFTNFNTVTAHSGPSALRLLRAVCGQTPHGNLYAFDPRCSLLDALRGAGYRTYAALDHDGAYQGFGEAIRSYAHTDAPLPLAGLPVRWIGFDGTPISDDEAVLKRWWDRRRSDGGGPAALYANIITMHAGSHLAGSVRWWKTPPRDRYRSAFSDLTRGVDSLEKRIASSGRSAVLVFVPEHGAALRGSSIQAADLREMPLPYITIAPVGIKLIGFPAAASKQIVVSKPTSYLGLASVLADILRTPPPYSSEVLSHFAESLPETPFVSENESGIVLEADGKFYLKARQGSWTPLPPDALAGRSLP